MDWRERFTDRVLAVQDPTPTEGEPLRGFGAVTVSAGRPRPRRPVRERALMAGRHAARRLPWASRRPANLHARDGFPDPVLPGGEQAATPRAAAKNVLIAPRPTATGCLAVAPGRAPVAGFRVGRGTLTADLDVFNVLNRAAALQVARDIELAAFDRTREIVRPAASPAVRPGLASSRF